MNKLRILFTSLGIIIALIPNFLSVWGGVKNWIVVILGLLIAVLSYIYLHEQQNKQ